MQELTKLDVPIGPDYAELGTCLLNGNDGTVLQELKHDYHLIEDKLDVIFSRWLQGKGQRYGRKSNTWGTFIDCLNFAELRDLADNIKSCFCGVKDSAQKSMYKEGTDILQDNVHVEPVTNVNYLSAEYSNSVMDIPKEGIL